MHNDFASAGPRTYAATRCRARATRRTVLHADGRIAGNRAGKAARRAERRLEGAALGVRANVAHHLRTIHTDAPPLGDIEQIAQPVSHRPVDERPVLERMQERAGWRGDGDPARAARARPARSARPDSSAGGPAERGPRWGALPAWTVPADGARAPPTSTDTRDDRCSNACSRRASSGAASTSMSESDRPPGTSSLSSRAAPLSRRTRVPHSRATSASSAT